MDSGTIWFGGWKLENTFIITSETLQGYAGNVMSSSEGKTIMGGRDP